MSVLFCLPPSYPVTGATFNYALVSLLACIAFGVIYWFATARHNFHGPKRTVDDPDSDDPELAKKGYKHTDSKSGLMHGVDDVNAKDMEHGGR